MSPKTISVNEVSPKLGREFTDSTCGTDSRRSHTQGANDEAHRRTMSPDVSQTIFQAIRQNHGACPAKRIHRVPIDQSDDSDTVSTLLETMDKDCQAPFGTAGRVAPRVDEQNPDHCPV